MCAFLASFCSSSQPLIFNICSCTSVRCLFWFYMIFAEQNMLGSIRDKCRSNKDSQINFITRSALARCEAVKIKSRIRSGHLWIVEKRENIQM